MLEVGDQQIERGVRVGEARVPTSALPLDRRRFAEQTGAPEKGEEDDRGRGGALQALVPATAPRANRGRGHRWFFSSSSCEGLIEAGCFHHLGRECGEWRRSSLTEIAKDAVQLRDPHPFLQVGVRTPGGSAPRFVGRLGQDDDLRRRRVAANLTNQTRVRALRHALMQNDRVGVIVAGKVANVDGRKRDREQLEPGLLHEELHQRALQGNRDGDEDPQCWVRSCCQTRVLGSHIRSVHTHRRPRDSQADGPPGGRAFTVVRSRSKGDTSTAGHGWVTWKEPARPIWTIS
jgi:hypothetical protein